MNFEALWTRYQEIHEIAPLSPYVAYVLYVHRRLFAWDIRSVLPALAHRPELHRELGLLTRGPQQARDHRRAAYRKLSTEERAEVIHDALTSDIFESDRKRVPLKGLLVNGGVTVLNTGDRVDPFGVFRSFDAGLGIGRTTETPVSALSEPEQRIYHSYAPQAPDPSLEDIEDQIQQSTAPLHGAERVAVQHFLRAKAQGISLKAYCRQHSLSYKSIQQAAKRGFRRLRPKE
jgi:hypothetical protein